MAWTRFGKKKDMPGGLWIKCESCGAMLFRKEFDQRNRVCQTCNYHFTLPARDRVALTADEGSFEELWKDLGAEDVLGFNDRVPYGEKLKATRAKTGEQDAMVTSALAKKGHAFGRGPRGIALVFAAEVLPNGTRIGVADSRSGGAASAY